MPVGPFFMEFGGKMTDGNDQTDKCRMLIHMESEWPMNWKCAGAGKFNDLIVIIMEKRWNWSCVQSALSTNKSS